MGKLSNKVHKALDEQLARFWHEAAVNTQPVVNTQPGSSAQKRKLEDDQDEAALQDGHVGSKTSASPAKKLKLEDDELDDYGDEPINTTQPALGNEIASLANKRKLEDDAGEDEPLAGSATASSAKKVKLEEEREDDPAEQRKVIGLLSAGLQWLTDNPKTKTFTEIFQVKIKPAGTNNLNRAAKRPRWLGGTGKDCPHLGCVSLFMILDCWPLTMLKDSKITQEVIIETRPPRNKGGQTPTRRTSPNSSLSNGQDQGQVKESKGKGNGLSPLKPLGIRNFHFACYANTTIHALARSPEFDEHYRGVAAAHETTPEVAAFVAANAVELERPGKATRSTRDKRKALRKLLEKHKEAM